MKKPRYLDIIILLGFLLLLSAGISLLANDVSREESSSDKTELNQLSPLFMARSTKKIADSIAQRPNAQQLRLVTAILDDKKNPLEVSDKIKVLLELALKTQNRNHRIALFNTLIANQDVAEQKPLLFIAAESNYDNAIPEIADWLVNHTAIFNDWYYKALAQSIKEDKPAVAEKLLSKVAGLTTENATKLLWLAVKDKKSADFMAPLIKHGANPNDAQNGKTPLILAAELNLLPVIQALIANGALVNKIIDPAIGSALQIAIRNKDVAIEQVLRKKGAVE